MDGKVWLVGAGPGDPELITVKGRRALEQAEVVVYDELVSKEFLDSVAEGAEVSYVGRQAGLHEMSAGEISSFLIHRAREGKRVVRLTGGDPFVFGPCDEEAEALRDAGIDFEVVNGVTSAVAAPAHAGIPITIGDGESSFAVVRGDGSPSPSGRLNWEQLATATDTLVLMEAAGNLENIAAELIGNGRPADTPVAVVSWGTHARQQTIAGTLADIAVRVQQAGMRQPAVTIVGEVVRLRERLRWYDDRPLFGKKVLIARSRLRGGELRRLLRGEGAEVVEMAALEVVETAAPEIIKRVVGVLAEGQYAWVIFSSSNAVELFFRHLEEHGRDTRVFGATKICAIGPAVVEGLARHGIRADIVAGESVESIKAALAGQSFGRRRILFPRAENARPDLLAVLRKLGAEVEDIPLYVAAVPRQPNRESLARLRRGEFDIVTFVSSFSVENVVSMLGDDLGGLRRATIACAGEITAQAARDLGLRADVVAADASVAGLVAALKQHHAVLGTA